MTSERTVPFFPYSALYTSHEAELLPVIQGVLRRGAFILQKEVAEFERAVADFVGAKHVVGLANATDALFIALHAAGITPGDEVICSAHTFIATAGAVHFAGGTPVPVECSPDHLIDPDAVAAAITPRTKAILPTQLNGRTCDMDRLQAIADRHRLCIVEDSAQGLGSRFRGRVAGTFGLAGVYSFYPAKILGCFGDGGALVTNDDRIAEIARLMRDHGRGPDGKVERWGVNSRLDNLQAAVLNYFFARFPETVARRRALARSYHEALCGVREVTLPPPPEDAGEHFDTYQNYEIEAERRDALRTYLQQRGIGTLVQWGGWALHHFSDLGFTEQLPRTDALFQRLLMLPMNNCLADADVEYVADAVRQFYRNH